MMRIVKGGLLLLGIWSSTLAVADELNPEHDAEVALKHIVDVLQAPYRQFYNNLGASDGPAPLDLALSQLAATVDDGLLDRARKLERSEFRAALVMIAHDRQIRPETYRMMFEVYTTERGFPRRHVPLYESPREEHLVEQYRLPWEYLGLRTYLAVVPRVEDGLVELRDPRVVTIAGGLADVLCGLPVRYGQTVVVANALRIIAMFPSQDALQRILDIESKLTALRPTLSASIDRYAFREVDDRAIHGVLFDSGISGVAEGWRREMQLFTRSKPSAERLRAMQRVLTPDGSSG